MQGPAPLLSTFGQFFERLGVAQLIAAHRVADSHQLLANDAAGSDGEVAHLRVAHLLIGEAHMGATGLNQGVWIGMPQGIHHRGAALLNRVVLACVPITPTIKNGENDRCNCSGAS